MAEKMRVGLAGLVHDHVWVLAKQWQELDAEVVAAADPNQPLLERMQSEYGVARAYADYHEMLAEEDLQIVQVGLENSSHADVVEAAAAVGVDCLVEKPMAATYDQADRMVRAAEAAGIKLMVNWPLTWNPAYRRARELVAEGAIGRVIQVKHRGGHSGPLDRGTSEYFRDWLYDAERNGAGAYMDYSGYGVNVALDYLEGPRAVYAHAANLAQDHHTVDDNSILIVKFARAMAVVEGTWTERFELPWTTFITGAEGALMADYHTMELVRFDGDHESGEPVALVPPSAGERNGPEYFVARLQSSAPVDGPSTARRGRDVQEVLQAGLISMAEGREVTLPLGE
ncbi:MAG: Gfo/Idh/MocA family oxidoreductase [Chloroflexota bacterium]|nr:Gfo/Idh/MocA family oxidoreductase [Chloroflexota bacterium]